jgi:hypothetical protein
MRYLSRAILPGGLGFAVAVLLAACGGGSGLLSANQSTDLNHQLDAVASAISAGQCTTAASAAQGFDNSVANLTTVNPTLTNNLKQASSALAQQAGPDCHSRPSAPVPTTTKPKTTPSATTTTPKTTPSTPSTTTPSTSTPTNTATGPANTATSPATTTPSPGNTTTNGGSGGAGVGGTGTGTGGSGGASPGSG